MMKQYRMKKLLCLIGCVVLIAAMALNFTGCGSSKKTPDGKTVSFQVLVTDLEGKETTFDITTDKATVGEALLAEGLIAGEQGEYGLYITSVNGITVTWEADQKYWSFYINGEYALAGVDSTPVEEGAVYSFKPEG